MNERLVDDWLTNANERSYQTPFAQSLIAKGMQVLRVGHSPFEHGKDIIARDQDDKIHAYQLKTGDIDLKRFEDGFGQLTALVETQVEHSSIRTRTEHAPWLVTSGHISPPVEDRVRVHNETWRRRGFEPLRIIDGRQLLTTFVEMASNFWPQRPEDARALFSLYLADGNTTLDRDAFAKVISSVTSVRDGNGRIAVLRKLSAANLFASYALAPFDRGENHWELIQGWTIAAAQIAWAAEHAHLAAAQWTPTFRLAADAAINAVNNLAAEALEENALHPKGLELDELTRSRCTICAGLIAANVLIHRIRGQPWDQESKAKNLLECLFNDARLYLWGESAVPFFLVMIWALDQLRADFFPDSILFNVIAALSHVNSRFRGPKLPPPYDSADDAILKMLGWQLDQFKAQELQSAASYTLEPLVLISASRLWKNALAACWSEIGKIDLLRVVPDEPDDLLLWQWGYERGANQSRRFPAPQSWPALLIEARRGELDSLPSVIKENLDFALLFPLCFPHRLTRPLAKFLEQSTRHLPTC